MADEPVIQITEQAPADDDQVDTSAEAPAAPTIEVIEHKVFVGNLSFATTEAELKDFFTEVGAVKDSNIITRGNRSLGYGFVAFETPEDAQKAVAEFNKKELGGREINVEVAKPKVEGQRSGSTSGFIGRRGRGRFGGRGRGRGGRGRRGRGRGRGSWSQPRRFIRRPVNNEDNSETIATNTNAIAATTVTDASNENATGTDGSTALRGRGRGRGRRGRGGRRYRGPRRPSAGSGEGGPGARRPRATGPPSKTTVFVANLPFSMNDEKLKSLFAQYDVKKAHVVMRRGSNRSKGYGFVELANEEEQQKALEGMKNASAEGRELVVKVALSEEGHPEENSDQTNGEGGVETKDEATATDATENPIQVTSNDTAATEPSAEVPANPPTAQSQ